MSINDVLAGHSTWHIETVNTVYGLAALPDNCVHTIVTSPPYWAVRSYGTDPVIWDAGTEQEWCGELGSEPTVDMFVRHLAQIFHECKRVLHPSGVLWLNIGDTYFGGGRGPTGSTGIGNQSKRQGFDGASNRGGKDNDPTLKDRDLCLIPERLAIALQNDGWWIRSRLAWCKASAMPESIKNRPTAAWEHVWMCTKQPNYYFDMEAVRMKYPDGKTFVDFHNPETEKAVRGWQNGAITNEARTFAGHRLITGAQPRNYWVLSTEPFLGEYCRRCGSLFDGLDRNHLRTTTVTGPDGKRLREYICPKCKEIGDWVAHYATFPSEVVKRTVLATTSEKGVCPQCGSPWRRVLGLPPEAIAAREKQKARRNGTLTDHGDIAGEYVTGGNALTGSGTGNQQEGRNKFGKSAPTADMPPAPITLGWEPTCRCRTSPDAPGHAERGDLYTGGMHTYTSESVPYAPVPALVLDPFSGSGTTAIVSIRNGRRAIGFELMSDYAQLSRLRIGGDSPLMQMIMAGKMSEVEIDAEGGAAAEEIEFVDSGEEVGV